MKWQWIEKGYLERARVPYGWLVRSHSDVCHFLPDQGVKSGWDWRVSICFVFDPFHWWKLKKNKVDEWTTLQKSQF